MDVSFVIPVYNEAQSVTPLYQGIIESVEPLGYTFEILLVDDGSIDNTFDKARQIAHRDSRLKIIKLLNNFGQTAALYAGFDEARGNTIITMDGDLQNDPADIKKFMQEMEKGCDLVVGWRENRKDRLLSRKFPSRVANWLIRKVTESPIKDNGCGLRAYRANLIKRFPLYSEMHRLLPTLLVLAGARVVQIKVRHHPRKYGVSKYGLSRVYRVLFDLITLKMIITSVRLPLFGFGLVAGIGGLLGFGALVVSIAHLAINPGTSIVVYLGTGILWGSLAIALLIFGMLCTLVYAYGNLRVDDLLKIDMI